MKKVSLRSYSALIFALLAIIFLVIYIGKYIKNGEDWALYFDEATSDFSYSITDRNGVSLATMGGGGRYYADDAATRVACYHVIGDYAGNVGTGALQKYRKELSNYSLISGIEHREDEALALTIDSELNKVAYNALAGRKGCVLIVNYKTGEIPCMVSSPSIDPLNVPSELPDGAYINRTISASFTPGSIYKLITLTAALDTMDDIHEKTFQCNGSVDVKGVTAIPHLGASTPESEDNCAVMAADQLIAYIEKGEVINSVNLPRVELGEVKGNRTCVIHSADALEEVKKALGTDVVTAQRGEIAYTVADIKANEDALKNIAGVKSVRVI